MKSFCITGVTLTGNKGGACMLHAVMNGFRDPSDPYRFDLLSIYARQDKAENKIPDLRIIPSNPILLIGFYLPLSLLLWPLSRFKAGKRFLSLFSFVRAILDASLVIDLSGIAFSDGRGISKIIYNIATCLPSVLFQKKVVKLSQALGPFEDCINRRCASFILHRCALVVGRGATSGKYLSSLGLKNSIVLPDVAFTMPSLPNDKRTAIGILEKAGWEKSGIIVTPSEVVYSLCRKKGIAYIDLMAEFLISLKTKGWNTVLLPHSSSPKGRTNDDLAICEKILARISNNAVTAAITEEIDPGVLRAMIAQSSFFIGSRFHAMISALVTGTPSIVIGWGHKYLEVLAMFEMEEWYLDWRELSSEKLLAKLEKLLCQNQQVRAKLQNKIPGIVNEARRNFILSKALINP